MTSSASSEAGADARVRVLGIETATGIASVGVLASAAGIERRRTIVASHASDLLALIEDTLRAADLSMRELDLVAVSIGPGSFTGLRIGLSVAKGLALAGRLPIVGVPTLEAYAASLGPRPGSIWPVLDARKGEVYAASFRWSGDVMRCVSPPSAVEAVAFADRLAAPCLLVGDGVDAYAEIWAAAETGSPCALLRLAEAPPSGVTVARLGALRLAVSGGDELAGIEPTYCRQPDAERSRAVRVSAG
jgi:tRNA threonylcarbamoyladenosine biosynthesis protein TsaB